MGSFNAQGGVQGLREELGRGVERDRRIRLLLGSQKSKKKKKLGRPAKPARKAPIWKVNKSNKKNERKYTIR